MRILDDAAVAKATPWTGLAEALRSRLAQPIESPPRTVLDPTGRGDALMAMPAWRAGGAGRGKGFEGADAAGNAAGRASYDTLESPKDLR